MEKILPWFALKTVKGIGNHIFKRLIDTFRLPEHVFEASDIDLLQVKGVTPRLASAIKNHKIPDWVKKDLDLVSKENYRIATMTDPSYPSLLLQLPDPPPFLYVYGNLENKSRNIAIVGSRNATKYGISATKQLAKDLVSLQITIVSGMARGIDTAAHAGALMYKGKTVAVLGSGLKRIYPPENIILFHKIAENGAVVSEFPLFTEPEPYNFPLRNRIISGICIGTVIVEAAKKSGSLITARLAADQGREVFAVPGSIFSFKSSGTHNLIKQGAKLVADARDIIEEFSYLDEISQLDHNIRHCKTMKKFPSLAADQQLVFEALEPYPIHLNDLVRNLSMEPGKLSSIMLELELKGIVQQSPGNYFSVAAGFGKI